MEAKKLIIIPVYNEAENIKEIILSLLPHNDLCIINDGSNDNTLEILNELKKNYSNLFIINNNENLNITRSIKKGFQFAIENNYQTVITMDAGNSHQNEDVFKFLESPNNELALSHRKNKIDTPFYRKFLSFLANICFSILTLFKFNKFIWIKDSTSGLRLYPIEIVKKIQINNFISHSFGFHFECLWYALNNSKFKFKEIPINYHSTNSSIRLSSMKDAMNTFFKLLFKTINLINLGLWVLIIIFNFLFIKYYSNYPIDDALIHFRISRNLLFHGLPYFNISDPLIASNSHVYILLNSFLFFLFGMKIKVNMYFQVFISIFFVWILKKVFELYGKKNTYSLIISFFIYFVFLSYLSAGLNEVPLAMCFFVIALYFLKVQFYICAGVALTFLAMTRNEFSILAFLVILYFRNIKIYFGIVLTLTPFSTYLFYFYKTIIPQALAAKALWGEKIIRQKLIDFFSWNSSLEKFGIYIPGDNEFLELRIMEKIFPIFLAILLTFMTKVVFKLLKRKFQREITSVFVSSFTIFLIYLVSKNQISFWYWANIFVPLTIVVFLSEKKKSIIFISLILISTPRILSSLQSLVFLLPSASANTSKVALNTNFQRLNSRFYTYKFIARTLHTSNPQDYNLFSPEVGALGWFYPKEIWGAFGLINSEVLEDMKKSKVIKKKFVYLNQQEIVKRKKPRFILFHPKLIPDLFYEDVMYPAQSTLSKYKEKQKFPLIAPLLGKKELILFERK